MNELQKQELINAGKILASTILLIAGIIIFTYSTGDSSSTADKPVTPTYQPTYQPSPSTTTKTYSQPAPTRVAPTYNGYTCTEDCGGHEAGYDYASDNDYTQDDVDNYSGNSDSFQEGLQSYVDEE